MSNLKENVDRKTRLKESASEESEQNNVSKSAHRVKGDTSSQQMKITKYIKNAGKLPLPTSEADTSEEADKLKELKEIIDSKDTLISKLKANNDIEQNKYYMLYTENKDYKRKASAIIAQVMLENAKLKRVERGKIDDKLGYFSDGLKTFNRGESYVKLADQLGEKQTLIDKLTDSKKSKSGEDLLRVTAAIDFLFKEVADLKKDLAFREQLTNSYKERLKLVDKESRCRYMKEGWPLVYDQYQTLELLGSGGFGEVYKCFDLESNSVVALKVNNFEVCKDDPAHLQDFKKHIKRQAEIQLRLHHPNIAKLNRLLECQNTTVTFVLEYCSGPQLSLYLRKNGSLDEKEAKNIVKQIFCALNYLYGLKDKIIHYDLKPSNIIFHHGVVKIVDFGLSKIMNSEDTRMDLTSQGVGTYWYLPPQTFAQSDPKVSSKVDVWSTGVIFYEMLYGKRPFGHGISQTKIYNQGVILRASKVEFPAETPKKNKISDAAKEFICACLKYEPDERLSSLEACQHPYFKK